MKSLWQQPDQCHIMLIIITTVVAKTLEHVLYQMWQTLYRSAHNTYNLLAWLAQTCTIVLVEMVSRLKGDTAIVT